MRRAFDEMVSNAALRSNAKIPVTSPFDFASNQPFWTQAKANVTERSGKITKLRIRDETNVY